MDDRFITMEFKQSKDARKYFTSFPKMVLLPMDNHVSSISIHGNKDQRIKQLESALGDMGEALLKIKGKADPSNDGKWHIFEVTCAAYALERNKEILDTINKRGEG